MSIEEEDVFRNLQKHLDNMPIGFPATESGIEIRVLKHLFNAEQAELATKLNFMPEPLEKIYRRVDKEKMTMKELEEKLDKMYQEGLINFGQRGETKYYLNAPLAIGIFEYQVNNLTEDFLVDFREYMEEGFQEEINSTKIPQLRTIPIGKSLTPEHSVARYEDIRNIIEEAGGPISVANCICKQGNDLLENPCKQTDLREVCFQFRTAAKLYLDKGLAREITKKEAFEIIEKAEEDGLVIQPGNAQRPSYICLCCGCCCEILQNQKRLAKPVQFFSSNYHAIVNDEICVGCGICVERCQMNALTIKRDKSVVNYDRCIGCGVCVPTCPNEALSLEKKKKVTIPPKTTGETYRKIMHKKAEIRHQQKKN
ncbi:MAG: hypothetical protein BAJALOKI2v1_630016 [Promethearchaeota archaeon]|nr:MAG: hypothetical protein BAJALOKI2v1_630016 [Candidatus Lokiarchaeota archaeon]